MLEEIISLNSTNNSVHQNDDQQEYHCENNESITLNCSASSSDLYSSCFKTNGKENNLRTSIDISYCEWNFDLLINDELLPTEIVAITGNCNELGNWKPELCVFLEKCEQNQNQWNAKIQLPTNKLIEYRYFICTINSDTNSIIVRKWETHLKPRQIDFFENKHFNFCNISRDIFGEINGEKNFRRGWLTNETIIQMKIYNNPFTWLNNDNKRFNNIHIKMTPMSMENGGILPTFIPISETNSKAIIEYVKFEYNNCVLRKQPEFGCEWNNTDDIIIFHLTVGNITDVAYLIEIYGIEEEIMEVDDDNDDDDQNNCNNKNLDNKNHFNINASGNSNCNGKIPKHLGYYYLLPDILKKSEGELKLPLLNSVNHQKLGLLNVSYLIIKPLSPKLNLTLRSTCTTFWKPEWTGLDIGHRGSGVSFRIPDDNTLNPPENTIASFKNAIQNGANMIELDVHVTKDGIPVVYHDFHVNISQCTSSLPRYGSDLIPVLIKDLTYNELKNLKTYHLLDGSIHKTPTYDDYINSHEYNLFPKLEDIFYEIQDTSIGYDIEIKWPQQLIDGTWESQQTIDKNFYCDCIISTILKKGYGRCIVLTCFDADICTLLRFKQNIYPVLFLTLGPTKRYPLYMDPRCNSINMAICFSKSMEFLGIIPHTEDLLNDPKQIKMIKDQNQIVFCWGDDSDCIEVVNKLKCMGLDGIIYDRVDKIIGRMQDNKRKIFLLSENDNNNDDSNFLSSEKNIFYKLQYVEEIDNENNDDCNSNGSSNFSNKEINEEFS